MALTPREKSELLDRVDLVPELGGAPLAGCLRDVTHQYRH